MLHDLYSSGNYEFLYAAMVWDQNPKADGRLHVDYNMAADPTCFFDGGHGVYAGGPLEDSVYINRIVEAGQRPVPDLDLMVGVEWLGNAQLEITVGIGNTVAANRPPETPDAPSGTENGVPGESYDFTALATDPDLQELEYQFDWGDGRASAWQGPFPAGDSCELSVSWPTEGIYHVTVRARDPWGDSTSWSTALTVDIGGCCTGPSVGNIDGSPDNAVTLGDLTVMIDHLFISLEPLECDEEGNTDMSPDGAVSLGDLTVLIDHLFISLAPLSPCP
ncbi:PKD domain-containing protein [candidate division GN15 bacterium]|nr:PKD domain-containing protein [candidate division GN15 bacterium]